jgi:TRAP-type mannitol/chloroaromatic compound transport system permease small subunit
MQGALAFTRFIDEANRRIAIIAVWLVLLCSVSAALHALVSALITQMKSLGDSDLFYRSLFDGFINWFGRYSNALSESQLYMFCAMVMLGAPWVLKINEHVRVDLVYGYVTEKKRTWIDLLGGLFFLLPFCLVMIYFSARYFLVTYNGNETGANSGLVFWPFVIWLPIGFFLLFLQAVAEIIKCIAALTSNYHREFAYEKPLQ